MKVQVELDRGTSLGLSAIHKIEKERNAVRKAIAKEPEILEDLMVYIFDGNPESISPLEEVRAEARK